ncbi:hypothetical protein DPMN_104181 [Dreissena polymorpha]|uniref:Uncharacterized protein n=1 Tax=Dreissena polymorpha TaxID=45954 RepID=A0A9D4HCK9_DREPO|nr:hypothetical protein DPMN_104181 [Dreissena polymorpha]
MESYLTCLIVVALCCSAHADIIDCDGSYMYLSCPVGQVCMCARGFMSANIVSHLSSLILSKPGYKLRFDNFHCYKSCVTENKNMCHLHASNGVFVEPCAETYKYMEVQYICF